LNKRSAKKTFLFGIVYSLSVHEPLKLGSTLISYQSVKIGRILHNGVLKIRMLDLPLIIKGFSSRYQPLGVALIGG
jgi:hypothetical protein